MIPNKAIRVFFAIILMAACSAAILLAQESRATLTGTVTDPQGAAVPGASIVAKNVDTNVESRAATNESGTYVLPYLNAGNYKITASSAGFKAAVKDKTELRQGQRQQLDFKLEIGAVSEQVVVTAAAELLNTTNAVRSSTIDAKKVADLPLLGKNPYTLAYHATGVLHINPQGSITDRPYDNGGMDYLSIAGGRPFTNEFLLDGAPNTNTERGNVGSLAFVPPPEATEEVAVITNNYDAQFGKTGGGVVSTTLKSGTNKLHGTVYHYHRNRIMNANTFQANRQNQQRGPFIWNEPGVTVHGPVYIPKLYDGRNRTFFLFSWEAIKQNIPNNPLDTVPTALNRSGDFSDLRQTNGNPVLIYDPLTVGQGGGANFRTPFANNRVPTARFDPVALKLMEFIPLPNFPANSQGFQNSSPTIGLATMERYNAYTFKVDQVFSETNKFAISYVRNRRWQTGPYYGWPIPSRGPNNFQRFNQGANATWTFTPTPTMFMTTRFGFTQHDFANFANGGGYDPSALGFPASFVSQAQGKFFPSIGFTNYTGFGGAGNSHDTSTNWYLTVSATKVVGVHTLKFGGEFRVPLDNIPNYAFASFTFGNGWTQRDAINADTASGNAFAGFLMGMPTSGSSVVNPTPAWGNRYYGVFIQDDWRIAKNLTVNIGGRWDYDSPQSERFNRQNIGFDPSSPSNFIAPGLPLKGGLLFPTADNRLTHKRDLNNFQPRVGLAWQFRPKSVFRAGYGLSYIPTFVPGQTQGFAASTPFVASTDNNVTPTTNRLSNPFPTGLLKPTGAAAGLATFVGQGISYVYGDRKIPYIQQYSAGFQHELPGQIVLDVSYVGSQTRKLGVNKNINGLTTEQLALGTTALNQTIANPFAGLLPGLALNSATTPRRNLIVPYPQFTSVTRQQLSVGKAWYHSLQFTAQKRLSHGLHLQLNYTYSTVMEAASYLNTQFGDDQLERVRTQEDLPHRADILGGYELPFFKDKKGILKGAFGGWQINAIAAWQSGRQLPGVDAYPTGVNPLIARNGAPDSYYFNACWVNTAGVRQASCTSPTQEVAWVQRPNDTLRTVGTRWSQIRELRPFLLDSSVFKTFYPKEGVTIQFRFEAFNTFNTPWFGQAQTGLTNVRFGMQGNSQTNDPRSTQLALKIAF